MLSPFRRVGLVACGVVGIMLLLGPAAYGDDGFVTTRRHETGVTIEVESTSNDKSNGSRSKDAREADRASEKTRPQTSSGGKIGVGATILEPSVDTATPSLELRVATRGDVQKIPECFDGVREQSWCQFVPPPPVTLGEAPPAFTPPTRDQVEGIVQRLASRMDLPKPMPNIGPTRA